MTMLFILFVCFLLVICIQRFKVTTFYIVFVSLTTTVIGNYMISNDKIWIFNLIAGIILFISYVTFKENNFVISRKSKTANVSKTPDFINKPFIAIIIFFIIYHFAVGGIPILKSNVEIERFNFTNSGLFGIPGRMVQYGIYFLVFYSAYFCYNKKGKKYFIISLGLFVICKLLNGFKGSMYDIVVMIVYLFAFSKKDYNVKKFLNLKFISLIIVSIGFAALIFQQYGASKYYTNTSEYLINRLTIIQAEAGNYMLKNMEKKNYFYNDFVYYIRKYLKINLDSSTGYNALEKTVSASKNGISLTENNFVVPVTVGAFNEFWFNINSFMAMIFMLLIGAVYGSIEKKMKTGCMNPFRFACYGLLVYMINMYISKGGLMYYVINYFLMILLMKIFYTVGLLIRRKN